MGLWTPMNPQRLSDTLNLPVDQEPSEVLTNLAHPQDRKNLHFYWFITLNYNLNTTGTHQNPLEPFSSK